MPEPKVFVFAPADTDSLEELESAGCSLTLGSANWSDPTGDSTERLAEMASGADALAGTSIKGAKISRDVLSASEGLRIVAKYTVGVDEIDVDAATELGILVTHAPTEANWGGVAETTVTKMLTLLKNTRERDEHLKTGGPWRSEALTGVHLGTREEDGYEGIVLGLIGLGRIGSRVSKLMAPWGMRIVAHDPYVADEHFAELGVERLAGRPAAAVRRGQPARHPDPRDPPHYQLARAGAHEALGGADQHVAGPAVDEPALVEALNGNVIAGAALDVFEVEPLPMESPLRSMGSNVLLSPHMSSHNVGGGIGPGIKWGTADVLHALRGEEPEHVYNVEALPAWRERFQGRSLIS